MSEYEGKPLFAVEHVSTGRGRIVEAGQQLGPVDGHIARSLLDRGLVTDSTASARKAAEGEAERKQSVERQIAGRSSKEA